MRLNFKQIHPLLFIISVFTIITAPALWTDGMFTDGIIYADISRNSAEGYGTFWHLKFSETLMNPFSGHPPLAFWLNSVSFKIFGDTMYAERIYSFLTGIVTIILLFFVVKNLNIKQKEKPAILTLFVFLLFPLVNWSFSNNMLENTVSVFVLSAFLFFLKSLKNKRFLMLFLSGIFLFAGFMSKGFTALFIWSAPLWYGLIFRKTNLKRMFADTFLLIFFTVLPLLLIFYFSKDAVFFFKNYFNEQILGSIKNAKTVNSRFYIIGGMLNEMIIPSVLILLFIIISKIKKININIKPETRRYALFFFLTALSGVLPMMISMKQRSFYIVPALPFLAVSFAFILNDLLRKFPKILQFFQKKIFKSLTIGLFVLSFVMIFIFANRTGRDFDTISDVRMLTTKVPEAGKIYICKNMRQEWALFAYLQRYGKISISKNIKCNYFLTGNKQLKDTLYKKINLDLKMFNLYKKTVDK